MQVSLIRINNKLYLLNRFFLCTSSVVRILIPDYNLYLLCSGRMEPSKGLSYTDDSNLSYKIQLILVFNKLFLKFPLPNELLEKQFMSEFSPYSSLSDTVDNIPFLGIFFFYLIFLTSKRENICYTVGKTGSMTDVSYVIGKRPPSIRVNSQLIFT